MELKNLESFKDEIAYLEEAEELLKIIESCFNSYYEFRNFVESKHTYGDHIMRRMDDHFNFDDSE